MVDIGGRPFIDYQLRLLSRECVHRVVICCGFLYEQIEEYVGDGSKFGLSVTYSKDGDRLRGTGGALLNALPLLGPEFLVMYGDSYLDIAFAPVVEAFHRSGCPALMTVLRNENQWDTSNIYLAKGKILAYDKLSRASEMCHIDFGLGCLRASAFDSWCGQEQFDLSDLYRDLVARGQLGAYEVTKRFYEIGSPRGLAETTAFLVKERGAGS